MLWYKSWLETRYRILFMLIFAAFPIVLANFGPHGANMASASLSAVKGQLSIFALYYLMIPLMLAGSGIKTQVDITSRKGLHGSRYFTLALPVSRLRIFATRAGLGMLEAAAVFAAVPGAIWLMFPALRVAATGMDLLIYWATICICATGVYGLGVLLSTFLDDLGQHWGSMGGLIALRLLLSIEAPKSSLNIFRALGEASPLFTHTLPWASMGVSLVVGTVLLLGAFRTVQTREY